MRSRKHRNVSAFAKFILERKAPEATITDLAAEIGISQPYLSNVLLGSKTPSLRMANKIADYFCAPRTQLYALIGWVDAADEESVESVTALAQADPLVLDALKIFARFNSQDKKTALAILEILLKSKEKKDGKKPGYR